MSLVKAESSARDAATLTEDPAMKELAMAVAEMAIALRYELDTINQHLREIQRQL